MIEFSKTLVNDLAKLVGGRFASNLNRSLGEWTEGRFFVKIVNSKSRSTIASEVRNFVAKFNEDQEHYPWDVKHEVKRAGVDMINAICFEGQGGEVVGGPVQYLTIDVYRDEDEGDFAIITIKID